MSEKKDYNYNSPSKFNDEMKTIPPARWPTKLERAQLGSMTAMVSSFGLPRIIIAGLLLLLFILTPVVGVDLPTQITNIINRFSWNAVLVLAMVPMIHSGCGLNFGLPLAIICGLLLPYSSPTMVYGLSGNGLRPTISLDGFYNQVLAGFLHIKIGNIEIPVGSLLVFALLAFLMWAFLPTKTGTAMTAVGSNANFARAAGINVNRTRMLSVIMSTWLGAMGILMYQQGFGFIQLYNAPNNLTLPTVSAILIGGASVNKASIPNVIIGTILFQGIVTMTPTVMNSAIHMDMSEVIRIIVSQGIILYALTRKTEGAK